MESNDLKEIDIKNRICYYFDDIIKIEDFDFDSILINEKSYKNILVSDISYKTLFGSKPLHIRFGEVVGIVRVYDGIRYFVLLGPEKYDAFYNRIRYPINQKIGITYNFSHNYVRIKTNSYDSLP